MKSNNKIMNKSKAKKTTPNHTTPKKVDNELQLLDIKIAKDFYISPFIYDKDGIEFVDILLDNLSLSKEFKKEICMKFIQSVFAPADEKKNQLAYDIIH